MKEEYDFSGGIRGKHSRSMQQGYTVTIHHSDGTTEVRQFQPESEAVILDPDVREIFPNSESVNHALRTLIQLVSQNSSES
ncbi:hypothetical protein ACQ4M3_19990 [Leptolyngbya sp. AN03gr2]|uniref:hypothetical protein n=1 Tax=unclassified Leptolyngbya TaxID=2650499 RepID=UPI003D311B91